MKLELKIFTDPRDKFGFCSFYFPLAKTMFCATNIKALLMCILNLQIVGLTAHIQFQVEFVLDPF